MKVVGIIAEYDPFHSGHAWQLAAARAAGAQRIVVCLSTAATQRGAIPLLPEDVRVRAALSCGADLVLSMPAVYAASGAEQFARAGVAILAAAGCDTLVFGAETPDTATLMGCAQMLCSPEYEAALGAAMAADARNFASARQSVMQQLCAGSTAGYGELLANPNDNLAVEYCKAILQQYAPLTPYALPRVGAGHGQALGAVASPADAAHGAGGDTPPLRVGAEGANGADGAGERQTRYASGSALRKLWQGGGAAAIRPYVPAAAYDLYAAAEAAGQYTDWVRVDVALLSRLRAAHPAGFAAVRGVSEGLEYRLADAVKTAITADGLYDDLTTVRYPRARMRRLCLDAALGVQQGALPALPPYLHVLGGHKNALAQCKGASLPAAASLAQLRETGRDSALVADLQVAFGDFSALCMAKPAPMSASYTKKIVAF